MKSKKLLGVALSTAMCLSILTSNSSALEAVSSLADSSLAQNVVLLSGETSNDFRSIDEFDVAYSFESIDEITANQNAISSDSISCVSDDVMPLSTSAPTAGLVYFASNPETAVNGNPSTETILIWLWRDASKDYTYPADDGSVITNYYVSGIDSSYIIGSVSIGGETVGFATKITVAAQHELVFQVKDSNGNYSNAAKYIIDVEPADGNTRPVCKVTQSKVTPYTIDYVFFDWSMSYDDDGDPIPYFQAKIVHDGEVEYIDEDSKYCDKVYSNGIVLRFTESGYYEIWISVMDNNNAWSNWDGHYVNVKDTPEIIELECPSWVDSKTVSWKEKDSNAYRTMTSRLGEGDHNVYVYTDEIKRYSCYTNKNGTYTDVIVYNAAPNTLYMSTDMQRSLDYGSFDDHYDPSTKEQTPRRLTESDCKYASYPIRIVCDLTSTKIIDFDSLHNPLVYNEWNNPSYNK